MAAFVTDDEEALKTSSWEENLHKLRSQQMAQLGEQSTHQWVKVENLGQLFKIAGPATPLAEPDVEEVDHAWPKVLETALSGADQGTKLAELLLTVWNCDTWVLVGNFATSAQLMLAIEGCEVEEVLGRGAFLVVNKNQVREKRGNESICACAQSDLHITSSCVRPSSTCTVAVCLSLAVASLAGHAYLPLFCS